LTVYRQPNPTAEDLFARREEDEYLAVPPEGGAWKQPRPGVAAEMQNCIASQGMALNAFIAASDDAIAPDYQKLVAQDALSCAEELGLGGADEPHPKWAGRPFSFSWGHARDMWQSFWGRLNQALAP
jgi:hypothetical protein